MSRITSMATAISAAAAIAAITVFLLSGKAPTPVLHPAQDAVQQRGAQEFPEEPEAQETGSTSSSKPAITAEQRDGPRFAADAECADGRYQGDRILPESIGVVQAGSKRSTGFVIREDGLMAAAAHGVSGHVKVRVRLGSKTHPASVVLVHRKVDVALLQVHGAPRLEPLTVRPMGIEPQGVMLAVGFPGSCYGEYRGEVVRNLSEFSFFEIGAHVSGGASGSPVLDENGMVAGLISGRSLIDFTSSAVNSDNWYHDREWGSWVRLAKVDW